MLCSLSTKLGEGELQAITDLEREIGHTLLAFSCHSLDPAKLQQEQLNRLQEVEQKLGVSLVAVEG